MLDVRERGDQFVGRRITVEAGERRVRAEEMPILGRLEDAFHGVLINRAVLLLGLTKRLLGLFELRDVAGKANEAGDLPGPRNNGHLGHGCPDFPAAYVDLAFELVDEGLTGREDALLVFQEFLGLFPRMKIEVSLSDDLPGIRHTQPLGHRLAAAEEARRRVLEVNPVRNVVQQSAKQVPFAGQFILDAAALGHVPENALHADDPAGRIVERRLEDVDE